MLKWNYIFLQKLRQEDAAAGRAYVLDALQLIVRPGVQNPSGVHFYLRGAEPQGDD